ncbi:helix-turn-helix transcriptional regulator [Lactiplantibacillus carotarum]|uniref:helix-turn-helix transcriptional regulator n=1 Tax=Lactiplantibacillus carotarum TaxID=2993456 RepID=UPI00298EF6F8|nr:helix-turn-helix transcriptional regulator [Lactiplantibacillus carotarum]
MIYEVIKEIAKDEGISIRSIERDLGFSNGTLQRWNDHSPSVEKVKQVSGLLKVPIGRLIYGQPHEKEK